MIHHQHFIFFKRLALFFIFLFCCVVGATDKQEMNDLIQDRVVSDGHSVRSSVWKIQSSAEPGNGTGFFIAPNKFVTNFHVIAIASSPSSDSVKEKMPQSVSLLDMEEEPSPDDPGKPSLKSEKKEPSTPNLKITDITLSQEGHNRILKVKGVLAVSALNDLALLETKESVEDYLEIREKPLEKGEDLFITGYPGGELKDIRKTSENIFLLKYIATFAVNNSRLDGASGSPVVDSNNQVAGVLHSSHANWILAVTWSVLQVFIQKNLSNTYADNWKQILESEIEYLRNLAKKGDMDAQHMLGIMYKKGVGVFQSDERATHWFEKAAHQGYALAQHVLAMYSMGEGVSQSDEKAFYWYSKSAHQGFALAQYMLGVVYREGWGVAQDYQRAFYWYKQAAKQGYVLAQSDLGWMYEIGLGVAQSNEQAFYWLKKAMMQDVLPDYLPAYGLLKKLAKQGYAPAQNFLGCMYVEGKSLKKDDKQAVYWFEQAAKQSYSPSQANLSIMYIKGQGEVQNYEKAVNLCKKVMEQDHVKAKALCSKYILSIIPIILQALKSENEIQLLDMSDVGFLCD